MGFSRVCAIAALIATSGRLAAQTNSIALTAPGMMAISTAIAGSPLIAHTDQSARYSVTVVGDRMRITGQVDTPLPAGVTLTISLAAPSGAVSLGTIVLSGSPKDLVRYISAGEFSGLAVTFVLTATVTAGVIPYNTSRVVLTLVEDP